MNIDLTKGTLANVLLIGSGILLAVGVLLFPPILNIFTHFGGYFLSVFLGFILLPFLKIRESKAYIKQTNSVINNVGSIIAQACESDDIGKKIARPAYDLFLREIPNGDRIISRIHDLGQQSRFMYAAARLFQMFALLPLVAAIIKATFTHIGLKEVKYILSFLPESLLWHILFLAINLIIFLLLARVFERRAENILSRQRNLERMAVFNNIQFFIDLGNKIKNNKQILSSLLPNDSEPLPNIETQP